MVDEEDQANASQRRRRCFMAEELQYQEEAEKESLQIRVHRLEERLQVYEKIDKRIAEHAVSNLNCFRIYLVVFSIFFTGFGIIMATIGWYGKTTLSEARDLVKNLEGQVDQAQQTLENLKSKDKFYEDRLSSLNKKVENIRTISSDVDLDKDGSGILIGGYDLLVMIKTTIDYLKKNDALTDDQIDSIIDRSSPLSPEAALHERGIILTEGFVETGARRIVDKH